MTNIASCSLGFRARVNVMGENTYMNITRGAMHYDIGGLRNVSCGQGAQIVNVPENSVISNITLDGGASFRSPWAGLRGAVLKFDKTRADKPVVFDGNGLHLSPAHSLMDDNYYRNTVRQYEGTPGFTDVQILTDSNETLHLVHSSWCHPNTTEKTQLFLPQGAFTRTSFSTGQWLAVHQHQHGSIYDGSLFLWEELIATDTLEFIQDNIANFGMISVDLTDGGILTLRDSGGER